MSCVNAAAEGTAHMKERVGIALVLTMFVLALTQVAPMGQTLVWLWTADALRNWFVAFYGMSEPMASETALVLAPLLIFAMCFLAFLALILATEQDNE